MPASEDFGSTSGTSASYAGGAGGIRNGGIGGGRGGGSMGGGAGINGGAGNRTGMTTGNNWHGNTAFGRPGGQVSGYGTMGRNGQISNFRNPDGSPVRPAAPPGLLGGTVKPTALPGAVPPTVRPPAVYPQAPLTPADVPALFGQQPAYTPWTTNVDTSWGGSFNPRNPYDDTPISGVGPDPYAAPGTSYNYNIGTYPGQGPGNFWGGGGLSGLNKPANRGPSSRVRGYPSTNGGY